MNSTKKVNRLDARWEAAKKEAERIQTALKRGYLVMDGDRRIENVQITEEGIFEQWGRGSKSFWFMKNKMLDNGYYTSVGDLRKMFRKLEFFKPVKRMRLA